MRTSSPTVVHDYAVFSFGPLRVRSDVLMTYDVMIVPRGVQTTLNKGVRAWTWLVTSSDSLPDGC